MRTIRIILAVIATLYGIMNICFGAGALHDAVGLLSFIVALMLLKDLSFD